MWIFTNYSSCPTQQDEIAIRPLYWDQILFSLSMLFFASLPSSQNQYFIVRDFQMLNSKHILLKTTFLYGFNGNLRIITLMASPLCAAIRRVGETEFRHKRGGLMGGRAVRLRHSVKGEKPTQVPQLTLHKKSQFPSTSYTYVRGMLFNYLFQIWYGVHQWLATVLDWWSFHTNSLMKTAVC